MLKHPMIWFVKGWRRFISPLYGDVCKFHPTCSAYGLEALQLHGAFKGGWLTVRRIGRCHPWSAGGVDYVPDSPDAQRWAHKGSTETADDFRQATTEVTAK